MEPVTRRQLLELMAGVGCAMPLAAMAATWKQVGNNAVGPAMTWKPVPYTGPAGTNWKKLGASNAVTINLVISANLSTGYNLKAAALATGWNGTSPAICTVTVNSGVIVATSNAASYAFDTGSGWPGGSQLALVNNGYIVGFWGTSFGVGNAGSAGGPSLNVRYPLTITNEAGYIYSGGGGGGRGRANAGSAGGYGGYGGGGGPGNCLTWVYTSSSTGYCGNYSITLKPAQPGSGAGGAAGALNVRGANGANAPAPVWRSAGCSASFGYCWGSGYTGAYAWGGGGGGGGASGGNGGATGANPGGPGGGHGLAITTNGNAVSWVSGNARVYGGIA